MGIVESPGIAYVINTDFGTSMSASLMSSVFESWPLFMLSFVLAYIAGFTIWAVVRNDVFFYE